MFSNIEVKLLSDACTEMWCERPAPASLGKQGPGLKELPWKHRRSGRGELQPCCDEAASSVTRLCETLPVPTLMVLAMT